ncbi:MAG TPA: SRPBCC domain-containing protein, partial [Anaeromyxobacteraceae bacterium]|nr:SRPBCC domain-containing protein [Anaeromyxobacteraceae bacterium]
MEAGISPTTEQLAGSETLFLTRSFDHPRRRVFQAWADADRLSTWWGPRGFTLSSCELDFHPGGAFHIVMRGPDGVDYPFDGVYREIVPNELIVLAGKVGEDDILTTVT